MSSWADASKVRQRQRAAEGNSVILFPKSGACSFTIVTLMVFLIPGIAVAQDNSRDEETITTTGTVSISTPTTLVVRGENGRHQVFVYGRDANRPASISTGSGVRVVSRPGAEPGVRLASRVTVTSPPRAADATTAADDDVVPDSVRDLERSVRRQVRRYNVGIRTGVALDPELVLVGVQSQIATGFDRRLVFRPNVDFAWGELTTMVALNLEAIYRLGPQGRWTPYFGAGPGFNFINASLTREDRGVDFSDFDYDTCLNLLGGVENRNGMFLEMKASVYANPAPSLRIILGYNF
jgi:hypothetical protein